MAKGRFLAKVASTSKKLAALPSDSSRLLWTWLLPHLDCEGRCHADPGVVKGKAVPRLKHFTERVIEEHLRELEKAELIILYEVDGDAYLQYTQFDKNQPGLRKDREAKSDIPAPPAKVRNKSGKNPEKLQSNSADTSNQALKYKYKLKYKNSNKKINFILEERRWDGIIQEDLDGWAKAYPVCDIENELAKAGEWIIANPAKGRKSNYRRFIVNWLSRAQDRGGTRGVDMRRERRIGAQQPPPKSAAQREMEAAFEKDSDIETERLRAELEAGRITREESQDAYGAWREGWQKKWREEHPF